MKETEFETKLINYLANKNNGRSVEESDDTLINEKPAEYIVKTKPWKYEPQIKTTEQLWANFKKILEQHNQDVIDRPLSVTEFNQVKKEISNLKTPYLAGKFLYGVNGVSQVGVNLDDERHVILTVFNQKNIDAGDTVYQVVNQIERPAVIIGKKDRRFDTTLLINGLPIIQIEEKADTHDVNEALNQMHQYIDENQYHDIFSTLQILIALTPNNIKYMANTTSDKFNKDFAFNWQRKSDGAIIRDWKKFVDSMLTIPMAHQMATNYMILDGTKNREMLKVMRPYQVYATQKVIDNLKQTDFSLGMNKIGYVWHTTGSGKTITSFKTAWLASRLPNVDKVVFVVDRIALTKQTFESYRAYDPDDATKNLFGNVQNTKNTSELLRQLKKKDNNIVVTSVQKLDTLVKRKTFKAPDKNIVFIVDEAHRSTGSDSFKNIQKAFKHSAWVGYTGTPMFDNKAKGLRTEDIFGPLLHAYTIREAIADRNVLGFKVDFEATIDEEKMKEKYLPDFYREQHPKWSQKQIENKINNLTPEDMDDAVEPSFYDENQEHIKLVVKDIFKNWRNRSNEGKYNALLTTHVGGNRASIPMAMMYFKEFQRVNGLNKKEGKPTLKVAITFSQNNSNDDNMLDTNKGLYDAMQTYNDEFGTSFGMDNVSGYTQDVISRLNKTAMDKKYLDLVIVVDQLLTGFDAPELNTLYVDRTLQGAGLIQAYSRTNRIADMLEKPWGRIVNYRWPAHNEKLMNEALAIYANKNSAKLSDEQRRNQNVADGVTATSFRDELKEVKDTVKKLSNITNEFMQVPNSEKEQERMFHLLNDYNRGVAKLKQYDPEEVNGEKVGFNYDKPEELVKALGMSPEQETMLTTVLTNELKAKIAKKKQIPVRQIDLRMTHVKDVKVNYDYLTQLVEDLLNQVHEGKHEEAEKTRTKINQFAHGLDDPSYAKKIINAASAIAKGHYPTNDSDIKYPVKLDNSKDIIEQASTVSIDRWFLKFRNKWGITDVITSKKMREWFEKHHYDKKDLDDMGQLSKLITEASKDYKELALSDEVRNLNKIHYRNGLRDAIYKLADELVAED